MRRFKFRFSREAFNAVSLAIIGAAIVLLVAGIIYYAQQERQRKAIEAQTNTTNQLINQVKAISEENRRLNTENRNFTYCNAVLLARYTQEQQPTVIEDLDKCVLQSFPKDEAPVTGQSQQTVTTQSVQPSIAPPAVTQGVQSTQPAASQPISQPQPAPQPLPTPQPAPQPTPNPAPVPIVNVPTPCVVILFIKTC